MYIYIYIFMNIGLTQYIDGHGHVYICRHTSWCMCVCADRGSRPSERDGNRLVEWGRRVCGDFGASAGVCLTPSQW